MVQIGIRMDGITALARGLAKCPDTEYIDLQDNTYTVDGELSGVETRAEALASWPNIHTLNLSDCVLSAECEVPEISKRPLPWNEPQITHSTATE